MGREKLTPFPNNAGFYCGLRPVKQCLQILQKVAGMRHWNAMDIKPAGGKNLLFRTSLQGTKTV